MRRWMRRRRQPGNTPIIPPLEPLDLPVAKPSPARAARPAGDRSTPSEAPSATDRWRKILAVAEALAHERLAREDITAGLACSLAGYDQFRRDVPIRPPPGTAGAQLPIEVLVEARGVAPFLLRATLRSLQDQSISDWTARVTASPDLLNAPVASFGDTDRRIRFDDADVNAHGGEGPVVLIEAGTILDPEALAWFAFALHRTGAKAAFSDHDHGVADPAFRLLRADPVLFGVFDETLIAHGVVPAVVALAGPSRGASGTRAAMLIEAARTGRVAHIPRLLVTKLSLPLIAQAGKAGPMAAPSLFAGECSHEARSGQQRRPELAGEQRIAVIIPTRDRAGLLARAIDSLRSTARRPERLDIVVVDNRSASAAAAALFGRLSKAGTARVVPFDAAFNWSLASNLGAAASDAPLIAFVNNDVEMLSPGWDDSLAEALSRADVGAVGARLLYPDRTVQHAGIAFGFGPSGAEHEGRGVPATDTGPGNRYITSHAVSAVTGAFLAVRRAEFEQLGGFDAARLMVAHSDVDLCLRLRELGKIILYCAAIEAIHHEGATRGYNETQDAIAWDEGERMDLLQRWGEALSIDPGISPYWQRGDRPFALLKEPSTREILAQIDRSVSPHPWRPIRSAAT